MQKADGKSSVKSSLADFGFVATEIPFPEIETKELTAQSFPEEHGELVYFPPRLQVQAYDLAVTFIYKGDVGSGYKDYKALRDYLLGITDGCTQLNIYDTYQFIGRKDVYLKKISDPKFGRDNMHDYLYVKTTFRVTNPLDDIYLEYVAN